jgi:hypothetical protein
MITEDKSIDWDCMALAVCHVITLQLSPRTANEELASISDARRGVSMINREMEVSLIIFFLSSYINNLLSIGWAPIQASPYIGYRPQL